MVPTLQQLAIGTLIRYKHCLSDVGAAPVDLLDGVLALCTAEELQDIEDGTRQGSGRELSPWLWPYWWALLLGRGGPPAPGERVQPLPLAAEVASGPPGVAPANYRALYEKRLANLERKRAESGARLRAMREEEERQRAARHVVVVDPLPTRKRQRSTATPPRRSQGPGAHPHRQLLSPVLHAGPSAKERLLRKLGMGRAAGSSSGSGGRAPPVRHTIIRPAGAPAAGGGCTSGGGGQAASGSWAAQRQRLAASPSAAALRQAPLPAGSSGNGRLQSPVGTPRSVAAKDPTTLSAAQRASNAAAATDRPPASAPQSAAPADAALAVHKQHCASACKPPAPGLDSLFIPKRKPPAAVCQQPSPVQSTAAILIVPQQRQQPRSEQLHSSEACFSQQGRQRGPSAGCTSAMAPPRPQQAPQHQAVPAPLEECDIFAEADAEVEQQQQRQQRHGHLGQARPNRPPGAAAGGSVPPVAHKRLRHKAAALPPAARPLRVLPLEEVDLFEGI